MVESMRALILIFVVLLCFPAHAQKVVLRKPPAAQCKLLVDSLQQQLDIGNYCKEDADCVVISLGCPFSCASPLNVNEDIARMAALKESYDHVCGGCEDDCPTLRGTPVCAQGKCALK